MMRPLRRALLASAAVALSAAAHDVVNDRPPRAHELDDAYTFDQYLAHFDKSYPDPGEYDRRARTFSSNLRRILAHNEGKLDESGELIDGGWAMGVNAYTDQEAAELPMGYNKLLHPAWRSQLASGVARTERRLGGTDVDTNAYSKKPEFTMDEVSSLPKEIDWASEGKVNPTVPNQGGCGSCWSFASTATIESHYAIATGEDVPSLSEQDMLQCTPNPDDCGGKGDCSGATVELALNYIADRTAKKTGGMYALDDVPYDAAKTEWRKCEDVAKGDAAKVGIQGWTQLESNSYKAVMNALAKVGPLAVAVAASGWGMYDKGVFNTTDTTVNHAVLLVGYGVDEETGEKFWKVRNSWGPGFGEGGYIRIKRTDDDDQVCAIDNDPLVGLACALDDNGNQIDVKPVKVCGTGALLFDAAYPVGVHGLG